MGWWQVPLTWSSTLFSCQTLYFYYAKHTISIIIPIYNIETYLHSSIQSVLAQSFTDFELILTDDGSTDSSGTICDEYAATDSRVRVIHKTHGGPSTARNAGIETALGEYIGFVDGDDWIEPDMYELLYKNSVTYDADLSACGFIKISEYNSIRFTSVNALPECYDSEEALRAMFRKSNMRYSACNKLFRRKLFDTIRYPEGIMMEDKSTTYKLIHLSNRIVWCPSPKYHYFMRSDSIMHTQFSKNQSGIYAVNKELLTFIEAHYPSLICTARASYAAECAKTLAYMGNVRFYRASNFKK